MTCLFNRAAHVLSFADSVRWIAAAFSLFRAPMGQRQSSLESPLVQAAFAGDERRLAQLLAAGDNPLQPVTLKVPPLCATPHSILPCLALRRGLRRRCGSPQQPPRRSAAAP